MNNKFKKLMIIFFIFLFTIFLLNIFIREIKTNKSDITKMNILNYIPSNYEFIVLSNTTNNNIKEFIKENISEKKRNELNLIKNSVISYFGFNLREKIQSIYDNEFALTIFENKFNKKDILLIFKLKKNKNINDIVNIGEELNISDHIIELKRLGKLNYISHIFLTKDNYILAASNKKLIDSSLKSNKGDIILSRDLFPNDVNLKEIKLLAISKYINTKDNSQKQSQTFDKLITIINSEDNKTKLRLFSSNINEINNYMQNKKIYDIKSIMFTNKYSPYKQNTNFLYNHINQKEYIEEISKEVNEKLLLITDNDNWVLSLKNKLPNQISIDQLNFLKKYKKEDLKFNNKSYSIFTNDILKIKDNNIIYEKKNPIFSLKDEENTYISNDFDTLLEINKKNALIDQYLNNNHEIKPFKYIKNDIFFIDYLNNVELIKNFKYFNNLQYFINTELFSLEDININISQTIPELHEKVYLESNFEIL